MTTTTATASSAETSALPSGGAILWLAWFSVREMLRRRRILSLALINLIPVLLVLAIRVWLPEQGVTPEMQLVSLTFKVFIPFLIPIAAMALGIPAVGEQVQDGTIAFVWVRPIRRYAIFLGRLLAAQTVSSLVMSLALVLCFLIMVSAGPAVITWVFIKLYLQTFLIIVTGVFVYTALFATVGIFFRKPVLPALLFTFGWENTVTNIPARVQELSLRFHLQNMIQRPAEPEIPGDVPGVLRALLNQMVQRDPVPVGQSVVILLVVMALATALGIWALRRQEIVN